MIHFSFQFFSVHKNLKTKKIDIKQLSFIGKQWQTFLF